MLMAQRNTAVTPMELLQSCTKPSMCSYYSVCAIKHLKQAQYENAILTNIGIDIDMKENKQVHQWSWLQLNMN